MRPFSILSALYLLHCYCFLAVEGQRVAEGFYYRLSYTFVVGDGRNPNDQEKDELMRVTDAFYLDSLSQKFPGARFDSATFRMADSAYNETAVQFVVQGPLTIVCDVAESVLPPTRGELFENLDELPLQPYFVDYLFQTQPADTNVFRRTTRIRTEFREVTPFDPLSAVTADDGSSNSNLVPVMPTIPTEPVPTDPVIATPPLDPIIITLPEEPSDVTTGTTPTLTGPLLPPPAGGDSGALATNLSLSVYYRFTYKLRDSTTVREPDESDVPGLLRETNEFYLESLSDAYPEAALQSVAFEVDGSYYDAPSNEYTMAGDMRITFDAAGYVPPGGTLFTQLTDLPLGLYLLDLNSLSLREATNIFQNTESLNVEFSILEPYALPGGRFVDMPTLPPVPSSTTPPPEPASPVVPPAVEEPAPSQPAETAAADPAITPAAPCPNCVTRSLRYRMMYDLQEGRGRAPVAEEFPPLVAAMNQFFLDSLNAGYGSNNNVVSVGFVIEGHEYNPDEIIISGHFDVAFLDSFQDVPTSGGIINDVLRRLDLLPFVLDYMFSMLPSQNVFRLVAGISAEFNQIS